MNKKGRLLLPTIGLVVLSGIAATSTTFAWFTTVRSATVTLSKATVSSSDSKLIIEHAHTWNATGLSNSSSETDGKVTLAYAGDPLITDISGDGKNFYKPIWSATSGVASSIIDVTPSTSPAVSATGRMVDFTIKISRDDVPDAPGLKVYLGEGTKFETITASGGDATQLAKDQKAIDGARMSAYTSTAAGVLGTKLFVHSPVQETGANSNYLAAGGAGIYGVSDYQLKTDLGVKHSAFTTAATNGSINTDYPAIAYLVGSEGTKTLDAYVNFRIWVEGTDSDTVNGMVGGQFKVTLDLYALQYNA